MHYPNTLKSKLPKVGTTIFSVMSKLAKDHNAINLSQGFPDFKISPELSELVFENMKKGKNQYAPMPGIPELREELSKKIEKLYSIKYNSDTEITITAGATQAIFTAITAVIEEEDEVIIFTPAYDCYAPAIELNGGKPVFIQLTAPNFIIDWEQVQKIITRKTRMIIINTPHNPSGTILTTQDMLSLEKIVKASNIIVLSDEVYEHIIYDGKEHQSVARYPTLAEHSFAVYSFGKTFHNTGWKMGYCIAPENLMIEFRKVHQFNVFSVNTPMQYALSEYLKNENNYLSLPNFYQEKRDIFCNLLKESRFKITPAGGTYFQLLDYSEITDMKDTEFAIQLTEKNKIASIPVTVFYNTSPESKVLRFCFAKDNETLEKAAEILCQI
ncbi:MAG: methionine aminotransferase [Flavobacteriales bacterium]|nr:methionine aminotransferase [Flavobacteriales bacterium]